MTPDSAAASGRGTWRAQIIALLPWLGGGAMLFHALLVAITSALRPGWRSVLPIYDFGAAAWWSGRDLYQLDQPLTIILYNFLPAQALLYTPIWLTGPAASEALWRLLSIGAFAWGLARLARLVAPAHALAAAGLAFLIVQGPASAAFKNGQAQVLMLALMMHATVEIHRAQWARVAALLSLALALKPLAIVMILLVGGVYPRARLTLLAGVAATLLIPLLHPDPAYAVQQTLDFFRKMALSTQPDFGEWANLASLLATVGLALAPSVWLAIAALAALATLALARAAATRLTRECAGLAILLLSVFYLLLFSPRTEANSYIGLGAALGLGAAFLAFMRDRPAGAIAFAVAALAVAPTSRRLDPWLDPLIAAAFLAWALPSLFARRAPSPQ